MSDSQEDLFARFLDPHLQRIEDHQRSQEERQLEAARQATFREVWNAIYNEHDFVDHMTGIVGQLMSLVDGIEERFWDFEIPRLLKLENDPSYSMSYNIAVAVLIYACRRDFDAIHERLPRAFEVQNDISFWHCRIYEELASFVRPPLTPPITETELAKVLETTRTAINNQSRAGQWRKFGPRGKRKWGHVDKGRQAEVLTAFREYFPSKPWLDVSIPDPTNA